eukprot:COSAG02_NODE_8_length_60691_cov_104.994752_37_plen_120_part_00
MGQAIPEMRERWTDDGAGMQNCRENQLGEGRHAIGDSESSKTFDRQFRNCRSGEPVAPACKMIGKINSKGRHAIGDSGSSETFDRQFRNCRSGEPGAPACKMIGKINTTRSPGRRHDSP